MKLLPCKTSIRLALFSKYKIMSYVSRFEVNNCHSYLPLNIMKPCT